MMSSINDVAKLYDEFEEAFVDVMTAKSEGLSFSRRMKLRTSLMLLIIGPSLPRPPVSLPMRPGSSS